ncbi:DUF4174 domain-containing protein [Deinococcus sp. HMF7620]|uniref:DUF4174 domain-containing protein n=1 Tax=Deinococcus arboris TaxID=2682977 RepID=A0A7C9MRG7_9DEIO|nr:DUF4174 domain-containing protein [Deinococcus arboris]MVN87184.1 DUF4174 domain-containing protein [Deinococcus arboris]
MTLRALSLAALMSGGAAAFTLPTVSGVPWSLAQALGRERVLILVNPPAASLAALRAQDTALQVYDLRVVALLPPGDPRLHGGTQMLTLLADKGGVVGRQYAPAALIGKDTGVKARYRALPTLKTVLALIDTMPMRQQERQERGQ